MILAACLPLLALASAQGADAACDRFDRPDAPEPGPGWVVREGALGVAQGQGLGLQNESLMTHAAAAAPWHAARVAADFAAGAGVAYVALVAGYASGADCVFVKIQDNDGNGLYDGIYFYRGNNGNPWSAASPQWLPAPLAAGRIELSFEAGGDVAVFVVTDPAGALVGAYRCAGVLGFAAGLGAGVGVGSHGGARFDDFESGGGCGPVFRLVAEGDCQGVIHLRAEGASGEVAVLCGLPGWSVQDDPRRPCLGAGVALRRPWLVVVLGPERPSVSFNGAGAVCGVTAQGVDLATCAVSDPLAF